MAAMKQVDFANGNIRQNVLKTALPMLAAQLLNLLYNIVDRIYIGRMPGEGATALGGVGLVFPVIMLILAFTNLYGAGGAPLCAIARGQGRKDKAEKIMNTTFLLLTGTAVILTLLGEIFCSPLLYAFGASDVTIKYAEPYLRIYLIGNIAAMISTGMNPYINAQGFPGVGMMTILIGTVANIILDPIFIFVFGMGVAGAAVATVISQCLSALFVIRFLRNPGAELRLKPLASGRPEMKTMKDIVSLGTASFIMQFTNSLVAVACNSMLAKFGGDVYISVYTVVSSVRQILDTPVGAIADGSSPVLSFNYGAKKYDRVRAAIRIVTSWAFLYTLVMWILVILFPGFFIRIFSSDSSIDALAVPALHTYFFAFIFQALQYSGQNVFKSLNRKKKAIFFSLFRKVVMVVPLTLILPNIGGLGATGVFLAEPISNFIGGTACFSTMILTVYRKLGKQGGVSENITKT